MEVPAFYLVVDVLKLLHYVDAKYAIPKKKKNATWYFDSG